MLMRPAPRDDYLIRAELRGDLVLPDTRNARELILPFDVQFDVLADISNIPRPKHLSPGCSDNGTTCPEEALVGRR
jgi:hypothetical protein